MSVKSTVSVALIEKIAPRLDSSLSYSHTIVSLQIHLLIFQATPPAFNKHIIHPAAFAIHTNLDAMRIEHIGGRLTGELATLITVENLWLAVVDQGIFPCFNAKV